MKKILVGTDLSLRSERARRRALAIAQAHGAELTLATVIDGELPAKMAGALEAEAQAELERVSAAGSSWPVQIRVGVGDPVEALLAIADEVKPDLLVLGMHRPRPVWDMFGGTTVERIVRATGYPVLLVARPVEEPYTRVLCGIDLSGACAAAARTAASLLPGADLFTFHSLHVPFRGMLVPDGNDAALEPYLADARARIDAWWAEQDLPAGLPRPEPAAASLREAFAEAMAVVKPGLIAVGAHARSKFVPTLLGSFTQELIRTPPADLLILRG